MKQSIKKISHIFALVILCHATMAVPMWNAAKYHGRRMLPFIGGSTVLSGFTAYQTEKKIEPKIVPASRQNKQHFVDATASIINPQTNVTVGHIPGFHTWAIFPSTNPFKPTTIIMPQSKWSDENFNPTDCARAQHEAGRLALNHTKKAFVFENTSTGALQYGLFHVINKIRLSSMSIPLKIIGGLTTLCGVSYATDVSTKAFEKYYIQKADKHINPEYQEAFASWLETTDAHQPNPITLFNQETRWGDLEYSINIGCDPQLCLERAAKIRAQQAASR